MTKQELIKTVSTATGLTQVQSEKAVHAFMDAIRESVINGEKVTLKGFGSFEKRTRKERNSVKPGTREVISVPAKDYVKFSGSKNFLD